MLLSDFPNRFIMSTLMNSCIELLKLHLRNTVDAYKSVTTKLVGKNVLLRIVIGGKDPSFVASCEWSGVNIGLDFPYDPGSRFLTTYLGVEDAKRQELNVLHMLALESLIWKLFHCTRTCPSP
ncbi:hypothetical protein A4A49_17480 [Nicotiana attenuata]|uniref:Uncharacterized protein n=1 Tax=Nicotiana attenuata TaxID=49451 RepID=A0A314KW96_NICAT|nr:hypothetical protein A4A49_17480 [Nicotiana attenuata]